MIKERFVLIAMRWTMSFVFLWAFLDKTFGLGFATAKNAAWIRGGSPTAGFLAHAVKGPFINFFHGLSGLVFIDWLFMLGLLFVGLTLLLNKYIKWGTIAGIILLALMYLALLFPENNPIVDEHIIYILVLALIASKSHNA